MTSSSLISNSSPEIVAIGLRFCSLQLDAYCHQLRQTNNRWTSDGHQPISETIRSVSSLAQGKFEATKDLEDSTKKKLDTTIGLFQSGVIAYFEERVDHVLEEGDKASESDIIYDYDNINKKFSSLDDEGRSLSREFRTDQTWQSRIDTVWSKLKSGQEKTLNSRLKDFTTTCSKPLDSSSSSSSSSSSYSSSSSSSSMVSSTSSPSKPLSLPPSYPFLSSTSPIPGQEGASSSPTSKTSSLLGARVLLRSILEDVNEKRIERAIQKTATLTTYASFADREMTICERVYFHNKHGFVQSADRFKSAINQTLKELPAASNRTILVDFRKAVLEEPHSAESQYKASLETVGLWDRYQWSLGKAQKEHPYL